METRHRQWLREEKEKVEGTLLSAILPMFAELEIACQILGMLT